MCEEKFETECKTIQVLNQNQLHSFYLTLPIFSTENENNLQKTRSFLILGILKITSFGRLQVMFLFSTDDGEDQ